MRRLGRILLWVGSLAALGAALIAAVAQSGLYDISALDQHTPPVYRLLEHGMRRSVALRAAGVEAPASFPASAVGRGLRTYDANCAQCHGAPGRARGPAGMGMTPVPANLVQTARAWQPAELFWVIKHGIKMTGMPAWKHRLSDAEIWEVVAFLRELPRLAPQQYRAMAAAVARDATPMARTAEAQRAAGRGDPARGREAIRQYACHTCHTIPGITGARANVGPPLDGIAERAYLAGVLINTPENLQRWLRDPHRFASDSAMPDLGVSEADARDIAAYLYALSAD